MLAGKILLVLGLLGYVAPPLLHYPIHDIRALFGLLAMFLGGLAWMVGYVVFAISFLPSKGE